MDGRTDGWTDTPEFQSTRSSPRRWPNQTSLSDRHLTSSAMPCILKNYTACVDFPTSVELAEDHTPEDDSRTKCRTFSFCARWPWPLTLTFKLGWDFCTMHLTAKFHHPMFNRSELIVLTNKQTHKQTPLKTSTLLRYAMLVGNDNCIQFTGETYFKPSSFGRI